MNKTILFLVVIFFAACLGSATTQIPCPCKQCCDINKTPTPDPSSNPSPINTAYDWTNMKQGNRFTEMGGWLFFRAMTATTGYELWKMKGPGTCSMVKDSIPGTSGQSMYDAAAHPTSGKLLFYEGSTTSFGNELWRSDGTSAGTFMVKDIRLGTSSSSITNTIVLITSTKKELCFFQANDGKNGNEIWVSNGTAAGTMMLRDTYQGPSSGGFYDPCVLNNKVLYRATDGRFGYELWITDGTSVGTVMLKDIFPGSGSSFPSQMTRLGKRVFFSAYNGNTTVGTELWESDGTPSGTKLFKDIYPGSPHSKPLHLALCGNLIYFWALHAKYGIELWVTNGTVAGTVFVKDCRVGPLGSSPSSPSRNYAWTAFGNKLVWSMQSYTSSGSTLGLEPWVSNGTAAGTFLLKDIRPGSGSSYARYMDTVGGTFTSPKAVIMGYTNDGVNGYEPWITMGTPPSTQLLKNVNPGPTSGYGYYPSRPHFTSRTFMRGSAPITGNEPWISDGTTIGTVIACNIGTGPAGNLGSKPLYFVDNYHITYFTAYDGTGQELFRTNGTSCSKVKDIHPTSTGADIYGSRMEYWRPSGQPHKAASLGKWFFFRGNNGINGYELWKTDGSAANTIMVADLAPGNLNGLNYGYLVTMGGYIYFTGSPTGSTANMNLYKTNGSTVTLVKSGFNSYWYYPLVVNNRIFFGGSTSLYGREPWVTNGTTTGTYMIKNIRAGSSSSYWYQPCQLKGQVYFRAYQPTTNIYALWKTNGTALGTVQLTPPSANHMGYSPTPFNGRVYFRGYTSTTGYEIWRTDGTLPGTGLHHDTYPGSRNGYFYYPCILGRYLYFRATNGSSSTTIPPGRGYELWRTDGVNTSLFFDCWPGTSSGYPSYMTNLGDRHMVFQANNGTNGNELWISNGTLPGTKMICDIWTGASSSYPGGYCLTNGHLVFRANNGITGDEPWVLPWCKYQTTGIVTATAQMIGYSASPIIEYYLSTSDPRLGTNAFLKLHNGGFGLVAFGFPDQSPLNFGGGAWFYPDIFLGIPLTIPLNASGTANIMIPPMVHLIGQQLTLQAFTIGKGTPLGLDFSNGVYWTLGDL